MRVLVLVIESVSFICLFIQWVELWNWLDSWVILLSASI